MKWSIIFLILIFLMIVYLLRKGIKDGKPDPDLIWDAETSGLHSKRLIRLDQLMLEDLIKDNSPMYQENDIDEFCPGAIISDQTIKKANLRRKLIKIEQERSVPDVDLE